ncbi:hypothetical protein ACJMK2_012918 [Sinanodonta woodiana]|uniref:Uncharacterized protein n=1 Tax=Sinanodonta woodiana TaxID=1069815 RepID=A0ABD3V9R7_SINWO
MAGRLKFPFICICMVLLVLPLVCSIDQKNNGNNGSEESAQNLQRAEKERRRSADTNVKGSGGNVPEIKTRTLQDGVVKTDVSMNKELTQKIIQDCGNKYELILAKGDDKGRGSCYLHKMNDRVYQKDCQGIKTEEEIKIDYTYGKEIVNKTLLSSIKGIEGCKGKPVIEMIELSVEQNGLDENWVVVERSLCKKKCLECKYVCKYKCR